jgi:hypothetical protein
MNAKAEKGLSLMEAPERFYSGEVNSNPASAFRVIRVFRG